MRKWLSFENFEDMTEAEERRLMPLFDAAVSFDDGAEARFPLAAGRAVAEGGVRHSARSAETGTPERSEVMWSISGRSRGAWFESSKNEDTASHGSIPVRTSPRDRP